MYWYTTVLILSNVTCQNVIDRVNYTTLHYPDTDLEFARLLQAQYDAEYSEQIRQVESKMDKNSKCTFD